MTLPTLTTRAAVRAAVLAVRPGSTTPARDTLGAALLLTGERGIGKTALLGEAVSEARAAGVLVVRTAGTESESALQYAGLQRLLMPLMSPGRDPAPVQLSALLTALGGAEGPTPDRFLVSLAARSIVNDAAVRRPVLLAVDDLDHLDPSSRDVVTFLARRIDRYPVSILATASGDGMATEAVSGYREITVPRLDVTEAAGVLDSAAPDLSAQWREWVLTRADGNPLALLELASLVDDATNPPDESFDRLVPLTRGLVRAFAGAADKLTGTERDAVLVAALAMEPDTQEVLAATELLTGAAVAAEALDAAAFLGLLTYDHHRIRFPHPLTRSALAARETASRRHAAHRALGFAVRSSTHRRLWHQANSVAGHDDALAQALEQHVRTSAAADSTSDAVLLLRRAAELRSDDAARGRDLLSATEHALAEGRVELGRRLHGEAVANGLSEIDTLRADLLGRRLGSGSSQSDRRSELIVAICRARAAGDEDVALDLAYAAALRAYRQPRESGSLDALARVVSPTDDQVASDERRLAITALIDPVGASTTVLAALHAIDDQRLEPEGLVLLAVASRAVGDYRGGLRLLAIAESLSSTRRLRGILLRALSLTADMGMDVGEWTRARAALDAAVALHPHDVDTDAHANLLATAAKAAALAGDSVQALQHVARIELLVSAPPGSAARARSEIARGVAYMVEGRHPEAFTVLRRVFDAGGASSHPFEQWGALGYLAEAAVRSGKAAEARLVLTEVETGATGGCSPLLAVQLAYARAVLAPDELAEERFVDALSSELAAWPWPRARLLLAYGRWLRRHRQVSRSRGPLSAAADQLDALGAQVWAAEARNELEASTPRRPEERVRDPALAALSTQEWRIAHLAASGLSNGEIGQQLALSPRTVGSHLYRLFPKLGITGRHQIAARLAVGGGEHSGERHDERGLGRLTEAARTAAS